MPADNQALIEAIRAVPAGRWGVGVSSGADSVTLLSLIRSRGDISPFVLHIDHQTRGDESTGDARFVQDLAQQFGLPARIARLDEIQRSLDHDVQLPANAPARYRALRLAMFRQAVRDEALEGVVLAHHADDQAETVLHRLLRGSSYAGLRGMASDVAIGGLRIVRPLLAVRRAHLREYLRAMAQPWREDASNASDRYERNRLRRMLYERPSLGEALVELGCACARLSEWVEQVAPTLPQQFLARALAELPDGLACETAKRWLAGRGVARRDLDAAAAGRLIAMARDAATPARQHFPGRLLVRRRAGIIFVDGGAVA